MSKNSTKELTIQRILVAVDNSKKSVAALEAAAILARLTKANIEGLYVQEERWHSLDDRPAATLIDGLTGKAQTLEKNGLKHEAELIAQRLKKQLRSYSRRHKVKHQWKSVRGKAIEEILKASKKADLITIGCRSNAMLQQKKLGSTTKAIIKQTNKPVLVLTDKLLLNRTIAVVYDGSKESKRSLKMGLYIAQKKKSSLFVFAVNNRKHNRNSELKKIEQLVDKATVPVKVATFNRPTIGSFIHIMKRQRPGLILISKKQPLLNDESLENILHYLNYSILLM